MNKIIQTADLCDDNKDKKIQVLSSNFRNFGGLRKFSGQIVTVKLDKSNWLLLEMLRDEDGKGRVIVVDNAQEFFGVVGDKLMAFALKNNWAAIILNGYVRDIVTTREFEVGLVAKGTCPRKYSPLQDAEIGVNISIDGVDISNGDYVYVDSDGIVFCKEKLV